MCTQKIHTFALFSSLVLFCFFSYLSFLFAYDFPVQNKLFSFQGKISSELLYFIRYGIFCNHTTISSNLSMTWVAQTIIVVECIKRIDIQIQNLQNTLFIDQKQLYEYKMPSFLFTPEENDMDGNVFFFIYFVYLILMYFEGEK